MYLDTFVKVSLSGYFFAESIVSVSRHIFKSIFQYSDHRQSWERAPLLCMEGNRTGATIGASPSSRGSCTDVGGVGRVGKRKQEGCLGEGGKNENKVALYVL